MRAHSLGAITERQKRSLFVRFSQLGWRTREPAQIEAETPRRVRAIIDDMRGDHELALEEIAHNLGVAHKDFVATYYPDRRGLRLVE